MACSRKHKSTATNAPVTTAKKRVAKALASALVREIHAENARPQIAMVTTWTIRVVREVVA